MLFACSSGEPEVRARPSPSPSSSPTVPDLELVVDGDTKGVRLVKKGIGDVKRIGLWRPLTRDVDVIAMTAFDERWRVPPKGHLADAVLQATDENGVLQIRCDIQYYSHSIAKQLDVFRYDASFGLGLDRPRSLRELYAAVVAHELAHCLPGPHGEKVAQRWERKAVRRFRAGV